MRSEVITNLANLICSSHISPTWLPVGAFFFHITQSLFYQNFCKYVKFVYSAQVIIGLEQGRQLKFPCLQRL